MSIKIIVFNAPPGAGKDAAVEYIVSNYHTAFHFSFKRKLLDITQCIYGVSKQTWDSWYTRVGKEIPRPELNGMSCRDALIFVSEKVIKVNFGKQYFGRQEALYTKDKFEIGYTLGVSSDGGFIEEIDPIIKQYGEENILIVQIYRPGYDFSNDSRSYIYPENVEIYEIQNDGSLEDFYEELEILMCQVY